MPTLSAPLPFDLTHVACLGKMRSLGEYPVRKTMNEAKCLPVSLVFVLALVWASCGGSEEGRPSPSQPRQVVPLQSEIDWEAARQHPRFDDAQLSEQQSRALEEASIPVLLPNEPESVRTALVTAAPGWYSLSMKHEGFSAVVSGSTHQLRVEGVQPPQLPEYGEDDLRVVRAEGIAELVFRAYGAIYTISVECEDPENDEHCTDDAYSLEIADKLLLSGVNQR